MNMKTELGMTDGKNNRKMPYAVPEGYFTQLVSRLDEIPYAAKAPSAWDKVKPYIAMAAAFAIIISGGTAVLKKTASPHTDVSTLEMMQLADLVPVTDPYMIYVKTNPEDISEKEIAEYLIDSGTSLEHIEYYKAK